MKLLFLTTLAVGAIAAPAHAAEAPAKVTSDAINGVTFLGTQTPDSVTFSLVGGKLVADAAKPLTAGVGCLTVAGDNTKVSCTIFAGRPIEAFASGGSDKLTNLTAIDSFFHGGAGDDKLIGGFGRDQLFGDAGDFDTVQGRVGADLLSGGPGAHDLASYADTSAGVFAKLDDFNTTLGNGEKNENDQLKSDIEDLQGGLGLDTLIGNANANTLLGGASFDVISGGAGADVLAGQDGADLLLSNAELGNPQRFEDGAVDTLNGGDDSDLCFGQAADGDTTSRCE